MLKYRILFGRLLVERELLARIARVYLDETPLSELFNQNRFNYLHGMSGSVAQLAWDTIQEAIIDFQLSGIGLKGAVRELQSRFVALQKKDKSIVFPDFETVIRTESMKITNAAAWISTMEVGSYADGLLWGFSYHAVGDSRTSQTHLAQQGVCAPVDDPFWNEWAPPNGYNCRCWLVPEWSKPSRIKKPHRNIKPDDYFALNFGKVVLDYEKKYGQKK